MFYLCAVLIGMISPVFWLFNAETAALFIGLAGTRNCVVVGGVLAVGECLTLTLLFHGGEGIIRRLSWLRRKVEKLRADEERFSRCRARTTTCLVVSSLLAAPPLSVMAILSPALGVRFRALLTISFFGRWLRFAVFAGAPRLFPPEWFPLESLPDWLRELV